MAEDLVAARDRIIENTKKGIIVIGDKEYFIKDIVKGVQNLNTEKAELEQRLTAAQTKAETTSVVPTPDVDVETLSNEGLITHLMEKINDTLGNKISSELKDLRSTLGTNLAQQDLDKVREADKEGLFNHLEDEMEAVATQYPEMSPSDVFELAKSRGAEKVESVRKEQAEKNKEEEEKSKRMEFGGLFPTTSTVEDSQDMSEEEAASSAWTETMQGFEDLRGS